MILMMRLLVQEHREKNTSKGAANWNGLGTLDLVDPSKLRFVQTITFYWYDVET